MDTANLNIIGLQTHNIHPIFPLEIFETVIDFIHDDTASLSSCGLVCREWIAASRFHLFGKVELGSFDVELAMEILCAEGSTIPQHVRYLEITNDDDDCINTIFRNLPPLPMVRTFYLSDVDWRDLSLEASKNLIQLLGSISKLLFATITFENYDQAYEVINAAKHVEILELHYIDCHDHRSNGNCQLSLPQLTRLVTSGAISCSLFDKLSCLTSTPTVQELSVGSISSRSEVSATCRYITHLGSILETLSLFCSSFSRLPETIEDTLVQELDLSKSHSLHSIYFSLILYAESPGLRSPDWVFKILSHKIASRLQTVGLTVYMGSPEELDILDLPSIDALFSNKKYLLYRSSTKLSFHILGTVNKSAVEATIRSGLPVLVSTGRLVFEPKVV